MARFNPNAYDLSGIRRDSTTSYLETMKALQEGSYGYTAPRDYGENFGASSAIQAGTGTTSMGMDWLQSFRSGMNNELTNTSSRAFNNFSTALSNEQAFEAEQEITKQAEKAAAANAAGGVFGAVANLASAFCERRLKTNIAPVDHQQAWQAVRDLPLYSFQYRHDPLKLPAYGPMVDEVQQVDPTLLVSMDEQARLMKIADGEPIYGVDLARRQAYESTALQAALRRIEQLEQRLAQLETTTV